MKYCDKFYEVSKPIKDILAKEGRQCWLIGDVESPYGTIPNEICYSGSIIPAVHRHCIGMSMVLTQKMSPTDEESCCGYANVTQEDAEGGISWEK